MSTCSLPSSLETPQTDASAAEASAVSAEHGARAAEQRRLRALRTLDILDTPPEPEFEDLVQLAAAICANPICAISFIDEERQWFKAIVGLELRQIPRAISFCNPTLQGRDLVVIEDASEDAQFYDHPMVVGGPRFRFYAGMPLFTPDGYAVGTFCMLHATPRTLTPDQRSALRVLSMQVNARLELRNDRRVLEQALQEAQQMRLRAEALEQRFHTFMDAGPFLAFMKDARGRMLYYNEYYANQFGLCRQASLNQTDVEQCWPAEQATNFGRLDREVLAEGKAQVCDEEIADPDGTVRTWRSCRFPCTDTSGDVLIGAICIDHTEDLRRQAELRRYQTELEEANQQLHRLASLDALTQVPNRRVFDEKLSRIFGQARMQKAPLAVLMLDVDHFKSHNDRFGHAHGDEVLRIVAQELKSNLRNGDIIARYGGEEFVILLPNTSDTRAAQVARRLVTCIRQYAWPIAPVTVSIGVSSLTPAVADPEMLVVWADQALYAAKCAGRDRSVSFVPEQEAPGNAVQPN